MKNLKLTLLYVFAALAIFFWIISYMIMFNYHGIQEIRTGIDKVDALGKDAVFAAILMAAMLCTLFFGMIGNWLNGTINHVTYQGKRYHIKKVLKWTSLPK